MKKRKELNALVANGKARCSTKKLAASGSAAGDGCCPCSQELLQNDGSDTSDTEGMSVLRVRKSLNGRTASRLCVACMPMCMLTMITACVVGSAMLIWMHLALREEVDMLRNYFRTVESGTRKTPEEFHTVHSQLDLLDGNNTANQESIAKITETLTSLNKEIDSMRKKTDSLSKSIAAEPEITMLPKTVASVQESVATLGSKITNVDSMANELKERWNNLNKHLQAEIDALQKKVDALTNDSLSHATTTIAPSLQTVEEYQHLGILFDELNKTMTVNFQSVFENFHIYDGKIEILQNNSKELANRLEVLKAKVKDDIPSLINKTILENVNQSLQNFVATSSLSDAMIEKNGTVKELLDNLTRVYNTLLTNFSRHKQEEEDLIRATINASVSIIVERYLSENLESMRKQQADQMKNLNNEMEKMRQYLENMQKTTTVNRETLYGTTSYPINNQPLTVMMSTGSTAGKTTTQVASPRQHQSDSTPRTGRKLLQFTP